MSNNILIFLIIYLLEIKLDDKQMVDDFYE